MRNIYGDSLLKRLLIADDDTTSRLMLETVLRRWGYEVVVARDGQEAMLAMLKADAPQMALLDWMMPGLDGPTVCRILKESNRLAPLYLIIITSRVRPEDMADGLNAGADDYIAKPVDNRELMARVSAGFRSLDLQTQLKDYSRNMEQLARKRAAQLIHADRMASLGTLSAGIAHEINNPASFVSINVQSLEQNWGLIESCVTGRASDEDRQRAQAICREVPAMFSEIRDGISRITSIVDRLKSYSRADGTRYRETAIDTCIDNALKLCASRLKQRITVHRNIPSDLPRITADDRQLEQVFVNLFINAADAVESTGAPAGDLVISASADDDWLDITIRDSGPGLTEDVIEQLFSPFFTTKDEGKGTGLGLTISQGIIQDHGGTLTASRADGGGAEFHIRLPRRFRPPRQRISHETTYSDR
jgi:C4-dicarboxylate-specific signal transduction histidine kinase